MAADRATILSWLADLSAAIVTDLDDQADIAARIAVATALDASGFANEAMDLMRVVAESVVDPSGFDRLVIPSAVVSSDTIAVMTVMLSMGLAIAGGRVNWPSRPVARKARSRVSAAGDDGLAVASAMGGDGADLYAWLSGVIETSCRLISDLAANAVPVVRVDTGISLPSTVLAYQLYGDASRASDLVDVAGAATPLVMPVLFDALAS